MYDKYPPPEGDEDKISVELLNRLFESRFADSKPYADTDIGYGAKFSLRPLVELPKRPRVTVEQRTLIAVEENPIFANLRSFHRRGATTAATILNMSEGFGHLNLSKAKRILDFGAGSGGPTLALVELAKLNGGTVDVVEASPIFAQDIIDSGIISPDRVIIDDGLKVLQTTSEKYDLITSFMLGPDDLQGSLTRTLLNNSRNALNPGGSILITSDTSTMTTVKRVCEQEGMPHDYIQGVPLGGNDFLPNAVIASFPIE
jgi:hypothetical protein